VSTGRGMGSRRRSQKACGSGDGARVGIRAGWGPGDALAVACGVGAFAHIDAHTAEAVVPWPDGEPIDRRARAVACRANRTDGAAHARANNRVVIFGIAEAVVLPARRLAERVRVGWARETRGLIVLILVRVVRAFQAAVA